MKFVHGGEFTHPEIK
jgi:hypothetical protein